MQNCKKFLNLQLWKEKFKLWKAIKWQLPFIFYSAAETQLWAVNSELRKKVFFFILAKHLTDIFFTNKVCTVCPLYFSAFFALSHFISLLVLCLHMANGAYDVLHYKVRSKHSNFLSCGSQWASEESISKLISSLWLVH